MKLRRASWVAVATPLLVVIACVGDDPKPAPAGGDAGVDAPSASSGSSSSSGGDSGARDPRVACSAAQCGASEVCCALKTEKWPNAGCRPVGGCSDRELACDGPEDCPAGQSCCAERNAGVPPGLGGAHCATTCPKTTDALCHSPADCGGKSCAPFDGAVGDFPDFVKVCGL